MAPHGDRDSHGELPGDPVRPIAPGWDDGGILDMLFANNAAPILLIDPGRDGAIVDANPKAAAFYGHSREKLRSLHVWDINALGRSILPAMREIASWEGGHYPQRFHHRLADGSVRDVQVYAGPILLAGRKLLLCIIHDLTAVIEAEQFNRLLLENVQVGVCGIDRAGNFTFVNPVAVRALGFRHESELTRGHIGCFLTYSSPAPTDLPPDSRTAGSEGGAAALHPIFQVAETGQTARDIDATFLRSDGTPFPVRLTASPIRNHSGIVGVVVSFSDLTAEREQEAQASDLANALPGAIFQAELHPDGALRAGYFSSAATELFGLTPESELTAPSILIPLMSLKGWARIRRSLRRAGRDGKVWEGELEIGPADSRRWLLGRAQPRRRADGTLVFNGVLLDITERKILEAELQRAAMHDPLTGAWNRRRFQQALAEAEARAERYGRPYVLALIDIDHFKRFNDTHGHQAGDDALRLVAGTLSARLRRSDALARWGGEEFALLLPETELAAAGQVLENLRQAVASQQMECGSSITVSIGAGQCRAGEDTYGLLQRVDAALYRAKDAGRNRVELA
ncbi:sensor domain-containing diguanylate cyclase [Azospirillum lipoferum]|nr:diguanylate cyclase [Azospirillum lipoferum]